MTEKKTYLFVPGAWMGDWVWHEVMDRLNEHGHRTYSLTLSGVGGNTDPTTITLQTHVDDVVTQIEANNLVDIILVGHSYSGLVVGMVADQMPARIRHVAYVKAFLPENGRALVDVFGAVQATQEREEIAANGGWWQPPTRDGITSEPDLSPDQQQWLSERLVPHPGRTVTEPVVLKRPISEPQATYIDCQPNGQMSYEMKALCEGRGWDYRVLQAGHWPMVSIPDALVDVIAQVAT